MKNRLVPGVAPATISGTYSNSFNTGVTLTAGDSIFLSSNPSETIGGLGEWVRGTFTAEAATQMINAGVDVSMTPSDYQGFTEGVLQAVSRGWITGRRIDEAVRALERRFSGSAWEILGTAPRRFRAEGRSKKYHFDRHLTSRNAIE